MINEYKINKGDRVRFLGDYDHYVEDVLKKGTEYTVVDADMCGCDLAVQCTVYSVSREDLELVEQCERRATFLSHLQSLLRAFDARISDYDEYKLYIDLGISGGDSEQIVYSSTNGFITSDNIMDFDKD